MLDHGQIMEGLREEAERFRDVYKRKEYLKAMWIYNNASAIAVFLRLPEEDMAELFGNRPYRTNEKEEIIDGLFKEEYCNKAMLWCIKNKCTRQEVVDSSYIGILEKK